MQRRAHPFFSGIGCGAALLLALVLVAIVYTRGGVPFSPGPLAAQSNGPASATDGDFQSHAAFEHDCSLCHAPWRGVTTARCEACHVGVAMQRRTSTGLHGLLPDSGRCQECHTEHEGRDASLTRVSTSIFDHAQTGFSLARHETGYDGEQLPCSDCHQQGQFTAQSVDCRGCHGDAEPNFMARHEISFGVDCLACHDGADRMASFDHASVFALQGAHADLPCSACHGVQQFHNAPAECAGCHAEPDVHAGLFGLECASCHTVEAWSPAQFPAHTFPLDHGDEGLIACAVCHEQTYTAYTCYNCHEHEPGEIREEHLDEGIRQFENCVDCHPTGREDEAEDRFDDNS